MGHQVNYFQTAKDIALLEQRLRKGLDFVIFEWKSPTRTPRVVDSLNFEENGRRVLNYGLARPEDLDAVVMQHVPEQGYWTFQVTPSPAIEIGTCYTDGTLIRRSRAYYVDGLYGPDDQWMMKSEEFRKWAKTILSTIKKTLKPFKRGTSSGWYIGEDAAQWHAAGGKLVD